MNYEPPAITHIGDVERKVLTPDYVRVSVVTYAKGRDSISDTFAMHQIAERLGENLHIRYPMRWLD